MRIEELTRIPSDVQDALITVLSEKSLPIAELGEEVQAVRGFNVIATANSRDRGVNELSSALKRRFNTVVLPLPSSAAEEVEIVRRRVEELGRALELPAEPPALEEIRRIVTIFRELRSGQTEDGRNKLKVPSATLSTAEAIAVVNQGLSLAAHFGNRRLSPEDVAAGLTGAVVRDPVQDGVVVARVPRDGDEGARRLEGPVPGLSRRFRRTRMTTTVLGIRHHGPGSARSVAAELERLDPDIVLIEGPPTRRR